jgi:hypothetical protein
MSVAAVKLASEPTPEIRCRPHWLMNVALLAYDG